MDSVKLVSSELMDTIRIALNLFFRTNGYHMDSVKPVSSLLYFIILSFHSPFVSFVSGLSDLRWSQLCGHRR